MSVHEPFNEWTDPVYLLDRPYLNGSFLSRQIPKPTQRKPVVGVIPLPTCAGTHVVQGDFAGAKSPNDKVEWEWTITFNPVDSQDDYELFMVAMAKGGPVYWTAGQPCVDTFNAVSGSTYKVSRPLADGIVPDGSLATDHAYKVYLDGVLTPSAASVSGQTVTAANTGEITIIYCPVHRVLLQMDEALTDTGVMGCQVTLTEIIVGPFD